MAQGSHVYKSQNFWDSLSPEQLSARPHTLDDLERKIAALLVQRKRISARICVGVDRAYWEDCFDRNQQQLAILREAHSTLVLDGLKAEAE